MSYTPTEWETADIVTTTRMNALESAVGEMNMSYTPNTWSDGDILTAAKMNALEQAVASGGGGSEPLMVIANFGALSETYADIKTAYTNGAPVICHVEDSTFDGDISRYGSLIYVDEITTYDGDDTFITYRVVFYNALASGVEEYLASNPTDYPTIGSM